MESPEQEAERKARADAEMRAAGGSTTEHTVVDYFGFEETYSVTLPDGISRITHKTLNEGARRRYMNEVNREVRLQKSGDAFMKMASGDERHILLEQAICGWNLQQKNQNGDFTDVRFSDSNLKKFLSSAPPKIVDLIEKDIREKNDWLTGDVTVEDIDEQIKELEELRETIEERDEGNDS